MWGRLAVSAILASCTFTPNPGSSHDGNPGGEPALIDAPGSGSGSGMPDAAIDAPADAPAITVLPCPASYTLTDGNHPGSHYRQVTASANWQNAEADCANDEIPTATGPAHLIVLDDTNEATFIWNLMNSDQWVGSSDLKTEGAFLAVTDQQVVYTGMASGNDGGKDCLEVHNTGGVTTTDTCTNGHPYVCECDGRAADPTHF